MGEIAKLLKSQPDLKVFVVGHTDMVGDAAANVKLSQARAQAVISALVTKHGIAATRLTPFGAGPYAPVATNRTDEGRAKNRRVELVEIAVKCGTEIPHLEAEMWDSRRSRMSESQRQKLSLIRPRAGETACRLNGISLCFCVVQHSLEIDNDSRLVAHNPGVVTRGKQ